MSEPTTRIDAIGDNLYRISTAMPPPIVPGGFTFARRLPGRRDLVVHHVRCPIA